MAVGWQLAGIRYSGCVGVIVVDNHVDGLVKNGLDIAKLGEGRDRKSVV